MVHCARWVKAWATKETEVLVLHPSRGNSPVTVRSMLFPGSGVFTSGISANQPGNVLIPGLSRAAAVPHNGRGEILLS